MSTFVSAPPSRPSPVEGEGVSSQRAQVTNIFLSVLVIVVLFPTFVHSAELAKEKISVAYASISPSMSGIWMAKEIGAFERHGLNVDLIYISSGATAIQGLVGGSVQAALGASNAVVAAILKGAPIIAVSSNTSRPGMALWVQPEIQRAEQLQGKILAITRFGSTSDFVTRLVLKKLGIDGKVDIRQFGGVVEADLVFALDRRRDVLRRKHPGPRRNCWSTPLSLESPFR